MNTSGIYTPVLDGRKRKVRSLWQRGGKYYARLKIAYPGEETPSVRRIPLKATTVPEATKELRNLQVMRDKGQTVVRGRTPTLAEFAQQYIERLHMGNRKRPKTISSECGHLRFWTRELGRHRLHTISAGQIQRALDKRASDGRAPRTLNNRV